MVGPVKPQRAAMAWTGRWKRVSAVLTVGADLKLRRLGLGGLAGRNTAGLAPTADVPASILAALTGTSVDNATDWTNFVKRYWTATQ